MGALGSLVSTDIACQPGYMARGRRKSKAESARTRQIEKDELDQREQWEAEQQALLTRRLDHKWGSARSGLDRLGAVSRDLERLHREEARLLRERDDLVSWLRGRGQSWVALAARTRLSRQALMKRAAFRSSAQRSKALSPRSGGSAQVDASGGSGRALR